jgi:large subunit ribosomal protein L7/L12
MKIDELIKELNSLTVIEAIQLSRELEKRWGVSSAIRISIFNPNIDEGIEVEKYEFNVVLIDCGPRKIEVIKVLRMLIPNLDLKEAKDTAENAGSILFSGVGKEFAYQAKTQLEKAGARITIT